MIIPFDFNYAREAVELGVSNIKFKTKCGYQVDITIFRDPHIWGGDYFVEGFYYIGYRNKRYDNNPFFGRWTMKGELRNDGLETDLDLVIEITEI